jgi:hypothetical protein
MDARAKPGHDAEFDARLWAHSGTRHRPYCLVGAGYALIQHLHPCDPQSEGARGTPGLALAASPTGPTDLAASRQRGMPKSIKPQVRRSPASRARCLEVCSAIVPGGSRSSRPLVTNAILHRGGPGTRPTPVPTRASAYRPSGAPARGWRAGRSRLGPPRVGCCVFPPRAATAPHPASRRLEKRPSSDGVTGLYSAIGMLSSRSGRAVTLRCDPRGSEGSHRKSALADLRN